MAAAFATCASMRATPARADSTWAVNANGNWSAPGSWSAGVPNGVGQIATFGTNITAARVVTVDGNFTVGGMNFSGSNYTLTPSAGTNILTLNAGTNTAVINVTAGASTVATNLKLVSNLRIDANSAATFGLNGAISGTGSATISGTGSVSLNVKNSSWTGDITVNAGTTLFGRADQSLGWGRVVINPGALVNVQFNDSLPAFTLAGDSRSLAPAPQLNADDDFTFKQGVISSGGDINVRSPAGTGIDLGVLQLNGGVTNINVASGKSVSTFIGVSSSRLFGHGDLNINGPGTASLGSSVSIDGNLSSFARILFRATNVITGTFVAGANATFNQNSTLGGLRISGGVFTVAAGGTVTVNSPIEFRGGTVNATFAGNTNVTVTGNTTLMKLGTGYTPLITINQGALSVSNTASLGGASIVINPSETAGLRLMTSTGTVTNAVTVNPANAANSFGTVLGALAATNTLTGHVSLGGTVAQNLGSITLAGLVDGTAPVRVVGNLRLAASNTAYAGATTVDTSGLLTLVDEGKLTTTPSVSIERWGILEFDNRGAANLTGRLANSIPIIMRGGTISLRPHDFIDATETVGTVTLAEGSNQIHTTLGGVGPSSASLTIDTLNRLPGATVDFTQGGNTSKAHVFINQGASNVNGIIGGWAVINSSFAANAGGTNGIVAAAPDSSDLDTSTGTQNVSLPQGATTLTANRAANSIRVATNADVDLAGHTLSVTSGGIAGAGTGWKIRNGVLTTPGAELFVYATGDIAANIGGTVGLTKFGPSTLTLSGTNTYGGKTFVTGDGTLAFTRASALPANADITVADGAQLNFIYNSGGPINLKALAIHASGRVPGFADPAMSIDATSYDFQSGTIFAALSGNGPMVKSGNGFMFLNGSSPAYAGNVTVTGGTLEVVSPAGLGTGSVVVQQGRVILHASAAPTAVASITLAGGDLSLRTSITHPGAITVDPGNGGTSRLMLGSIDGASAFGTPYNLNLTGPLNIKSGTLAMPLGGTLTAGSVTNNANFVISGGAATLGAVSGTGSLSIGGVDAVAVSVTSMNQNAVTIQNGAALKLVTAGTRLTHSIGALSMGSTTATLDIGNHDVLIAGATSAINALVKQAAGPAAGGLNPWNGVGGITSALVRADAFAGHPGQQAIGVKNNADFLANGGKAVAPGKVLVSYAAYGDANLDNNVDIADLSIWNNNFGVGDHWGQGDFNYDGQVDIADLSVWNNNFGGNVSPSAPASDSATPQHKALASAGVMASAASLSGDAPAHANATPPAGTLELDIDPSTGRAYLNSGGVSLAAIQIDSSTKNMTPGTGAGNNWNSFRLTQGYSAKGWSFQKGGPTSGTVVESTTDATSASGFPVNLPAGTVYDYGAIFPVGFGLNAGDLATIKFQYNYVNDAQAGTTTNVIGVVALTPEPGSVAGLLALAGAGLMGRRRRARRHTTFSPDAPGSPTG